MPSPKTSLTTETEIDGNTINTIAICGYAFKFPQDATSPEAFWKMMIEKRCATTEFPSNRLNADGFYQKQKKSQTMPLRGAHFIKDDLSVFDADFFSISPTESASMDPMQRWLMETTYQALENAGMTMESISGSSTAVYTGSFCLDYMLQLSRDAECPPTYAAVGFGLSMLANRLSWFFNLRGPSIGLDSACSSTAMAIDIACQALHSGSCDMAIVAGSNLATAPEPYIWMSNLNFLSPDSRCYSFDHRANGYARGEGIGVIILKRVKDAIRDGNTIRAVIRSTGSNEDGRTPGITQPSRVAQECLIRQTYEKEGLSMKPTRFFEAHGTGTQAGDPREAQAIGSAFQKYRSTNDPLYVGSVKSNIGHLEGASGIAAVIKSIAILERGIIPPNANFEKVNPRIDSDFLKLRFPTEPTQWPTAGLRRISINSFGFGGANSHIVLDDAYNYLRLRSLKGKHNTQVSPPCAIPITNGQDHLSEITSPDCAVLQLLVLSTADKNGIDRMAKAYIDFYHENADLVGKDRDFLPNMAYTLANHRSHLQWRSYVLLESPAELSELHSRITLPLQVRSKSPLIGFVFNGQGAQWYAMGRELIMYDSFREGLEHASAYLHSLGCQWSVIDELMKSEKASNIDHTEFSQALCTVLQVGLTDLLRRFGVKPSAVVGHSSGEIAAAYAGGYLSRESAWKLAYFRGLCTADLLEKTCSETSGAMLSVGLAEADVQDLIDNMAYGGTGLGLSIACVNSPRNVTVSGEGHLIDKLKVRLDEDKVFARKLRVEVAYHSSQMTAISTKYVSMIGKLSGPDDAKSTVPLVSTVTGGPIVGTDLTESSYWSQNMISTVKFSQAISVLCAQAPETLSKKIDKSHYLVPTINYIMELGPHAALQGPLREILRDIPRGKFIDYDSVLRRGQSATQTTLKAMGELHCSGYHLDFQAINEPFKKMPESRSLLVNLPAYPFDHSQQYWNEGRLSRNYRLRSQAPSELLGVPSRDWNPSDARWRHFIRRSDLPWIEQHVVNGVNLYPGAGMLVMAIEAARQLAIKSNHHISGYVFRDVRFERPMVLSAHENYLEVQTSLRKARKWTESRPNYEFTIRTHVNEDWSLNCRGSIAVEYSEGIDHWDDEQTKVQHRKSSSTISNLITDCQIQVDTKFMYSFLKEAGYEFGPLFQAAHNQLCNRRAKQATAEVHLFSQANEDHVIHPVSLDAILHLCFTAFTSGGSQPMATSVPSSIGSLWLSNTGLSQPDQETVTAYITVDQFTNRGFSCSGGALSSRQSGEVKIWYEDLEITNVTSTPPTLVLPSPRQFCMHIEQKAALDKLTYDETLSLLNDLHPVKEDLTNFFQDIELLIEITLERVSKAIEFSTLENGQPWVKHYWNWMQHHLTRLRSARDGNDPLSRLRDSNGFFGELSSRIESTNRVGRLYVAVATSLESMLRGEAAPLELFMQTGLLTKYYYELGEYRCTGQAVNYLDLLAHQRPGLKILEVGGGTASTTRQIIAALQAGASTSDNKGCLRCSRYDFTDVSPAFLEEARQEFALFQSQMTFSTLDIERDLAGQGFEEETYDIVVADAVLHITSDFSKTLRNVRKALKPGGKLIMSELLKPDGWTAGFIFGVFPGWWAAVDAGYTLSPNLAADSWHTLLQKNGFSGADLVLRDFDSDIEHHLGCIISTATEQTQPLVNGSRANHSATIIVRQSSQLQLCLADSLKQSLEGLFRSEPTIETLDSAIVASGRQESADDFIIFIADYGPSFLGNMDQATWNNIKSLITKSRHLLWVSGGGGHNADPDHGLLDGLTRTLRTEYYELHLVLVALELSDSVTSKSRHLSQVVTDMLSKSPQEVYEQDYVEVNGRLHTRRLVEAIDLKSDMNENLVPYKNIQMSLGHAEVEVASSSYSGHDDAPHWMKASSSSHCIQEQDEIVMAVRAVCVQAQDHATVLNEDETPMFGSYCAGVVVERGPDSSFHLGDRVVAARNGRLRSRIRVSSQAVAKIPAQAQFSTACWIVSQIATAYHALIDIGRSHSGDRVLIHDGASLVGQAAIQLLTDRGITDVWTTAASESDSKWIMERTGLSQDHVLPRSWVDSNSLLISHLKRSFDIIFIPNGDIEPPSMVYVGSGGRYIMTRAAPISPSEGHQIQNLPSSLALFIIQPGPETTTPEALQYAAGKVVHPIFDNFRSDALEFGAGELSEAYSHLQRVNWKETVVLNLNETDMISVRVNSQSSFTLSPEVCYLIAGGLGGLGRDMARWLVSRGARYLILLSRSGPRTVEAQELLTDCEGLGVHVVAPVCDVTDTAALKKVLTSLSDTMPPIKGCIQSSMVMTERVFEHMEFNDWKVTVDPKVLGSWNLHTQLPRDLDFFILISSMMGITGGGSLSAYNAGNTYIDALARYRISQGERATSLNLGPVLDGGYLVQHTSHIPGVLRAEKYKPISVKEICALLDIYCDPEHAISRNPIGYQSVVGMRPPAHWGHAEEVPAPMYLPFWGHMHHIPPLTDGDGHQTDERVDVVQRKRALGAADRVKTAVSLAEAGELVSQALAYRIAAILGIAEDRLDFQKPMHTYGLDSLSAIDIRNWVGRVFDVDMPVFEILGEGTFASAGTSIARAVQLKR